MRRISVLSPPRLALAMTGLVALTSCNGGTAVEPIVEGGVVAVFAGRVTAADGSPVAGATLQISVFCSTDPTGCVAYGGAVTDENGRFLRWFDRDEPPHEAAAQIVARPPIGQGYSLGMAQRTVVARFQPVPPADTTFVELELPPNESDSRRPLWVQHITFRALARPLRADAENVYASTPGGIAALDQETGEYLWERGASGGLAGLPYVVVGGAVVMARDDVLSGLRSSTGDLLWTRQGVPNTALSSAGPDRLFATDGASIAAYDPGTGATRWIRPLRAGGSVSIGVGEDVVCAERLIVSPDTARVECWSAPDGESLWSRVIGSPAWVVVTGDLVILSAGETPGETGWIGLDSRTGTTIWSSGLPLNSPTAVSTERGHLYACVRDGAECLAVRTADGAVVWRRGFDDPMGSPVIGPGNLFVVPHAYPDPASLLVLDIDTGELRERIDPDPLDPYGFCGTPVASGDRVFVFGCWGYIYAFQVGP